MAVYKRSFLVIFTAALLGFAPTAFAGSFFEEGITTPHVLDITMIGDKYSDMNIFRRDTERFKTALLTLAPFKSRAGEIVFHTIENGADLGCGLTPSLVKVCNMQAVDDVLKKAATPTDKLLILVNGLYGGSGSGNRQYAIAGNIENDFPMVAIHELGHTLGLFDEYSSGESPITDNQCSGNCCHSSACTAWSGTPGTECIKGCTYNNWYRSSQESIMWYPGTGESFNSVSGKIIDEKISTFTNKIAPGISLLSPKKDTYVHGVLDIVAETNELPANGSVSKIEIYVDDKLFDAQVYQNIFLLPSSPSPRKITMTSRWVTSLLPYGSWHMIYAKVYDLGGNVSVSAPVSVTTDNVLQLTSSVISSALGPHPFQENQGSSTTTIGDNADVPAVASVSAPVFTRTLRRNVRGDEVKELQEFLSKFPVLYPEALVTGYFGSATELAVRRFQAKYDIVFSGTPESTGYGVVGKKTRTKLNELIR